MKKLFVSIGSAAMIAAPVALVVSCATTEIDYNVPIDNAKNYNYIITATDTKTLQPIPFASASKHKRIWDIKNPEKSVNQLDDLFGIKSIHQRLNFGIKPGKPFENGLERLIYDIIRAKNHNIDLTLSSGLGNMVIPKEAIKTKKQRLAYLKGGKFFPAFKKAFGDFGLLQFKDGKYSYLNVDQDLISKIIDKMSK